MKYSVVNDLSLFEFHDSGFRLLSFNEDELSVSVEHLNIHQTAEQNPNNYDMEISAATITFKGIRNITYEPGRTWKTGDDGVSRPVGPRIVFEGEEAKEKITEELQQSISVYYFEKKDDFVFIFDGGGIEPYFTMEISCDSVVTEWDGYTGKAWYVYYKHYERDVILATPCGDKKAEMTICVHESREGEQAVSVGVKDGEDIIWGHGTDYLWIDAFADLQKNLPDAVILKCCLTCAHGNMCPVGNAPDEFFCTKDLVITQKSDLYHCTEDPGEIERRLRQCTFYCEDFMMQSEDVFTYNDYICYFLPPQNSTKPDGTDRV